MPRSSNVMLALAVFAFSSALLAAAPPNAATAEGCSSDVFAIDATSVTLEICPMLDKSGAKTTVTEKFSVKNQPPLERELELDHVPGADSSRAIDNVSLEKLGIAKTLHVTVALKGGSVRLEHALLIPGAVPLK